MATLVDWYGSGTTGSEFVGDGTFTTITAAKPTVVRTPVAKGLQFTGSVQSIIERAFAAAVSGLVTVDIVMELDGQVEAGKVSEVGQWRNGAARGPAVGLVAVSGVTQVRLFRLNAAGSGESAFTSSISGGVPTDKTRFRVQLANDGTSVTVRTFLNDTTTTAATGGSFTATSASAVNPTAVRAGLITTGGLGAAKLTVIAIRVETTTTPGPRSYPAVPAEGPQINVASPAAVEPWATGVPLVATTVAETSPVASVSWAKLGTHAAVLEAGSGASRTVRVPGTLDAESYAFRVTATDTVGRVTTKDVNVPVLPATVALCGPSGTLVPMDVTLADAAAPATVPFRALGVLQAETTAQVDEVAAAGANTVYVAARWTNVQTSAGGPVVMDAINAQIDYAISKGMRVILRPGLQYPPAWARTDIPMYVDQDGVTWSSTNSGEQIRDLVWTAIGLQYGNDYLTKLITALTPARRAAIVSVQMGFGIYGENQLPRVNLEVGSPRDISKLKYWGFGAAAQTGTGLAADQVVCPHPGHKPFLGVPEGTQGSATDLAWMTWLRNSVRTRINSFASTVLAAWPDAVIQELHPSFGVRATWNSGHFGWREQNAQGCDWRHQIAGYVSPRMYPWCTDVGKTDQPWANTSEDGESAGRFLAKVAVESGRTLHLGGENTGGGTIEAQDRFFDDLIRYEYPHALYAFYSTLVDGTGDSLTNFTTGAARFLPASTTPTTPPAVGTIETTATVDLATVLRDLGPLGHTYAGVCSSTYGRRPSTSVPQAAAERALDARYWRLPVRWNDAGYIATSALGAGSFSIEPDIAKYAEWGHRMVLIIAGRGGDFGTWTAGDASKIAQRLLTLGYNLDLFDFSGPNEPGIDGSVAAIDKTPAKILQRNQTIHAELQTVQPGRKLWGPVHFFYNRPEINSHQQGMGAALAGTNYHHYAMGGSGESQTTAWAFDHTATYEAEVTQLRADAASYGVSTEVNVDEFNWAVKPNYAVTGSDAYYLPGEPTSPREARLFRAENVVYIASVLGRIMRAGGRGMVYATQNKSLGVMVQNEYDGDTINLPESGGVQRPDSSPMPAYWGVAAWTGGGVPALAGGTQPRSFPHMARRFYAVTQPDPLTEVYAVDNEAGGYNLVVINKRAGAARNVRLDLAGVPAGWVWERHRTRKAAPYDGFLREGPFTITSSRVDLAMEACTVAVVVLRPAT